MNSWLFTPPLALSVLLAVIYRLFYAKAFPPLEAALSLLSVTALPSLLWSELNPMNISLSPILFSLLQFFYFNVARPWDCDRHYINVTIIVERRNKSLIGCSTSTCGSDAQVGTFIWSYIIIYFLFSFNLSVWNTEDNTLLFSPTFCS